MAGSDAGSGGARETVRLSAREKAQDLYLSALLAPRALRGDLVTLAAFAGEIMQIPRIASEPMIGQIRLQWWRDALEAGARGELTGNPVADALADLARRRQLPHGLLADSVDGHDRELAEGGSEDEFEDELALCDGAPIRLALHVLDVASTPDLDELTRLAATAIGRTRTGLSLPYRLAHASPGLPLEYTGGRDVTELSPEEACDALKGAISRLAEGARRDLASLRPQFATMPRAARPAFLPLALVEPYLRALEVSHHDPAHDIADISPLTRVTRLWVASALGRI